MAYHFTLGAERALAAAACWSRADDEAPISVPELLLGLLQEPECRAARILADCGIDSAAVHARHADLLKRDSPVARGFAERGLAFAVDQGLLQACERLDESPRAFEFATEHLLLALSLAEDDSAAWLRDRGVTAEAIEADAARRYGGARSPIDVELGAIPLADLPESAMPIVVDGEPFNEPAQSAGGGRNRGAVCDGGVWRILDAAANRAGEALRVVEDYVRFVLDDAALMRALKAMRHELTAALAVLSAERRLAARDTTEDVGTTVKTAAEFTRTDAGDVVGANMRRLQESLRSLEEYAKIVDPHLAATCERLRYRSYTLQRSIVAAMPRDGFPATAQIYVLIDGAATCDDFSHRVQRLVAAGVDLLQLRDKQLDDRTLLDRARRLRELTRGTATRLVMNDRADLAALAEADGVHVGQEELTVADVRRIVGPRCWIGVSTHDIEQARRAVDDGADYLGVGPVFPSQTKTFGQFPGLEFVRAVADEIRLPSFAIGGITPANVAEVVQAGLRRIAVSGAVWQAADPAAAAYELRRQLGMACSVTSPA